MTVRDIKFRAWDKELGKMFYQGTPDLETLYSFIFHWGDRELTQFTGLLDKNGKDIYEGDILQEEYNVNGKIIKSRPQVVTWINSDACFGLIPSNPYKYSQLRQDEYDPERREVIGNVFENPALVSK